MGTDSGAPTEGGDPGEGRPGFSGTAAFSLHICALVLASAALYFGKEFFLPIVLGLLGALTLVPIVRWLERRGVPAALTAIVLVLTLAFGLGGGVYVLSGPVSTWIADAPTVGIRLQVKLASVMGSVDTLTEASKAVDDIAQRSKDPAVQEVVVREPGFLSSATSTLWTGLSRLGVALIMILFLLASGDMVYEKIVRVLPRLRDKKTAMRIVHDIERSISRYLLTITLINAGLGVAIALAMWAIGVPSPGMIGFAAALLNFLPYLGAIVGVVLTGLYAFLSIDQVGLALAAPAAYLVVTMIEGNIVTPMVLGRRLELNTVALFIGVAFWGWVWGLAGVLIAVPLMVVLKTLCDHLEGWEGLGEFLSITVPKAETTETSEPDLNPVAKT